MNTDHAKSTIFPGQLRRGRVLTLLALALVWCVSPALGQGISVGDPAASSQPATSSVTALPTATAAARSMERAPTGTQPFGANLFIGGFAQEQNRALNPNYRISEGDAISVRVWGAVNQGERYVVDQQGNIFLPTIGPLKVAGVRNADLNALMEGAVKRVYAENVNVYANLETTQPVSVYVTGFVPRPGRYPGVASNSILYFIDHAGGIVPDKGSFRDIRVLRGGKVIGTADLYDFLLKGEIPVLQFHDDDTVMVGPRRGEVVATGSVVYSHAFEFVEPSLSGRQLAEMARLRPSVSHVQVSGTRNQVPFSSYVSLEEFHAMRLLDGDQAVFSADERQPMILVRVEGEYQGPSQYALAQDATLGELLDRIPVQSRLADYASVSLRRVSVAQRQKQSLEESLQRLENTYLLASSATNDEASIRVKEAQMIADFVKRARAVKPIGRVVIANQPQARAMLLEDGDVVTLPKRTSAVLVSGEVLVSQALVFQQGQDVTDYIDRAGGFTDQADSDKVVVLHASGEVENGYDADLRQGDEILVLPKVPTKNMQLAASLIDIIYKIAVSSAIIVQTF